VADLLASVLVVIAAVACAVALQALCQLRHARRLQEAGDHALAALGAELVRLRLVLGAIRREAADGLQENIPHGRCRRAVARIADQATAALRDGES
jgi:hypothetical protein